MTTTLQGVPTLTGFDLAVETLAQIEVDQEHWNQNVFAPDFELESMPPVEAAVLDSDDFYDDEVLYELSAIQKAAGHSCGTAFCFAGWAVQRAGLPVLYKREVSNDEEVTAYLSSLDTVILNGKRHDIDSAARSLLGKNTVYLKVLGGSGLFAGDNELDDLYAGIAEMYEVKVSYIKRRVRGRVSNIHDEIQAEKLAKLRELEAKADALRAEIGAVSVNA